ncbi:NF038129 family PEP-CTERM protein [Aquisphaera insulae]|uniref:NF038129 family PEP-CTERM protein n=1 Tax=Aquisphaera insulae TaxID=2712864 RepID=UPI0013EB0C8B|nr:NF038129 family PEP-CTERM protein [Aquisphaera insulae]
MCDLAAVLLLLLGACHPGTVRAGSISYLVEVNTTAITGQDGNLDFQFNPGGSGSGAATATVTDFLTAGGVVAQPPTRTGDASGSLPGSLTLNNSTAYNDVFQGFTFGTGFSFTLTLTGPALDSPGGSAGSSFALSLYDASGVTPLLTTDPNGSVLTVDLDAEGTVSTLTFPQASTDPTPIVRLASVPEPAGLLLLGTGFVALLASIPIRAGQGHRLIDAGDDVSVLDDDGVE